MEVPSSADKLRRLDGSPRPAAASAEWWRQAVVYQVYPHSFADSNGDGLGDLRGILSRVPYLTALGIDAVWLSPFSPSALADGGSDMDGYRDLDLGTLADFDEMTATLHANGIKILIDFAPDHNFGLLEANWSAGEFLRIISDVLVDTQQHGAPTTWVLERGLGLRRACAATLLMLALPGSAYLCQGEELGLHEVAERDGRELPLPWTPDGPSFGFGAGAAHLPQPAWFGPLSVQAQEHDPASTLTLYRQALGWRRKLQAAESLEWMPGTNGQVLDLRRPGGWRSVTNFGSRAVPLPDGTVGLASGSLEHGLLPADTTAWILPG